MKNLIEIVLEEKTKGLPSSILYNQWEFDKKLIPNAMLAISAIFPHYSLHNESHSETIISNFIKILGENVIRELSATDLWLLLEVAYCHDLGMIVTAEKAKEAIESGKLLQHFLYIQNTPTHDLFFCTKNLEVVKEQIVFTDTSFNIDKSDVIKYLLADYFRTQHGANAPSYILNPLATLSLNSPRAIIPDRLYELLGKICNAHTQDFQCTMELPRIEDGIDIEQTHPRFIACMLRLGDLLDIDNGRFSETLLRTLGTLPNSTSAHIDKHKSTKRKLINTKSIEIIAECNSKNVAHITQQWFNWIQEEFTLQTLSWNSIAPPNLNVSLPSVRQLSVNLIGYENIDPKNKPVFTVDTPKALELLQGANFYESPFKAIRELVQNSIDATLLRIWEEHKHDLDSLSKLLKLSSAYPIEIRIEDNIEGYTLLEIMDKGTGISRDDLRFLASTGSSSKNIDRKTKIQEIPLWMQPVGFFGIGFQSSFLLTDLVEISTNSIYSNKAYAVELHSPKSKYRGDIYIKEIINNKKEIYNFGTKLTIKIDKTKAFNKDSIKSNIHTFSNDYSFAYYGIIEELKEICKYSFIPIKINGENITRGNFNFLSRNNIELKFQADDRWSFCFKNIVTSGIYLKNYQGVINYHNNNSHVLTLSRKDIREDYVELVKEECISALEDYYFHLKETNNLTLDIVYCIYTNTQNITIINELKEFIYTNTSLPISQDIELGNRDSITLKDLYKSKKIQIKSGGLSTPFSLILNQELAEITFPGHMNHRFIDVLLVGLSEYKNAKVIDFYETQDSTSKYYVIITEYANSGIIDISSITIDKIYKAVNYFSQQLYNYYYCPEMKGFEKLSLKKEKLKKASFIINYDIPHINGILFPIYRINSSQWKDGRDDKFYEWVANNLIDNNISKEEIIELYDKLVLLCIDGGFNIIQNE